MQYHNTDYNFEVPISETLTFDESLVELDSDLDQLIKFVATCKKLDTGSADVEDRYLRMVDAAIRKGNIPALEILWQGIGFMDCYSNGNYEDDLVYAAKFGNLKMFQHILYAYGNYGSSSGDIKDVSYKKLVAAAEKNPDTSVLKFIKHIDIFDGKDLEPWPKKILGNDPEFTKNYLWPWLDEGPEFLDKTRKFYQAVESFQA